MTRAADRGEDAAHRAEGRPAVAAEPTRKRRGRPGAPAVAASLSAILLVAALSGCGAGLSRSAQPSDPASVADALGLPRLESSSPPILRPPPAETAARAPAPAPSLSPPPEPPPPTSASPVTRPAAPLVAAQPPADECETEAGDDWNDDDWDFDEMEIEEVVRFDPAEPGMHWHGEGYSRNDRTFGLHNARGTRAGQFHFVVDHRGNQPATNEPFRTLFGLDEGGLMVALGFRYGFTDFLDAGAYRLQVPSLPFDVYEFDLGWQAFEDPEQGLGLRIRGGLTWFEQRARGDAVGGFAQGLLTQVVTPRLLVTTGVLYHSDSSGEAKRATDPDHSIALGLGGEIRVFEWLALAGEMVANVAGFGESRPVVTFGPKFVTTRHTFGLVLTNTQLTSADGIVTNTSRSLRKPRFGFTITREL